MEIQAPRTVLPRTLQEKAEKGMFQTCEQVEQFVDDTGKYVLVLLKRNFNHYSYDHEEEQEDRGDNVISFTSFKNPKGVN